MPPVPASTLQVEVSRCRETMSAMALKKLWGQTWVSSWASQKWDCPSKKHDKQMGSARNSHPYKGGTSW